MANERALIDLPDDELLELWRAIVARGVQHSASDCSNETLRRQQAHYATVLNRWTLWIAVATIVNALATIALVAKELGLLSAS